MRIEGVEPWNRGAAKKTMDEMMILDALDKQMKKSVKKTQKGG